MQNTTDSLHLVLTPNRSLGPKGYRIMMAAVVMVSLISALRFALIRAWPVGIFLFVDVGLLWWAFHASYNSGKAYEDVRLADGDLVIRQVNHYGKAQTTRLNAFWVRVVLDDINDFENRLRLVSHGKTLTIASFLAPYERVDVKLAIEAGLARANG